MDWIMSPWAALFAFVVMAGLSVLAGLGVRFRYSRDRGLETTRDNNPKPEPLMPEKFIKDVIVLVEKVAEHRDRLNELKISTIEEQMRYFEEAELAAVAAFKRGFNRLVTDLPVETARREQRAFVHMVKTIFHDIKDQARKWFHTNHYYEMSDSEWDAYLAGKKEVVTLLVSEAFDVEWISDVITRDQLRQIGETESIAFHDVIEQVFTKARQVSLRKYEAGQEERAIYSAHVMRIAGYDPYNIHNC